MYIKSKFISDIYIVIFFFIIWSLIFSFNTRSQDFVMTDNDVNNLTKSSVIVNELYTDIAEVNSLVYENNITDDVLSQYITENEKRLEELKGLKLPDEFKAYQDTRIQTILLGSEYYQGIKTNADLVSITYKINNYHKEASSLFLNGVKEIGCKYYEDENGIHFTKERIG